MTDYNLILEAVNQIQAINLRIAGIESAPPLGEYPSSLDTMQLPCVLSEVGRDSTWLMGCGDNRVHVNLICTVYVHAFAQEYYGVIKEEIHRLAGAFRRHYLTAGTYLDNDIYNKNIYQVQLNQLYLDQKTPFRFTGHQRLEYPAQSRVFWHGFIVNLSLYGVDGEGNCDS